VFWPIFEPRTPRQPEVRRTGALASFRTQNPTNTCLERYRYTNSFVVTTYCLVIRYQGFRGKICLHPQGLNVMMDAAGPSNTSVSVCKTKRRSFPEHSSRRELVCSPRSVIRPSFRAALVEMNARALPPRTGRSTLLEA
jgi:hypothetical protein